MGELVKAAMFFARSLSKKTEGFVGSETCFLLEVCKFQSYRTYGNGIFTYLGFVYLVMF